jgi:hypothetical protein
MEHPHYYIGDSSAILFDRTCTRVELKAASEPLQRRDHVQENLKLASSRVLFRKLFHRLIYKHQA